MAASVSNENQGSHLTHDARKSTPDLSSPKENTKSKPSDEGSGSSSAAVKRRCVSTACIACRKRKSKCDGSTPSCAACASVYGTECVYDPNSDHRRKGVYKKDIDRLKTRNSTLQTIVSAILNYREGEIPNLIKQIRTCESLDDVAEEILTHEAAIKEEEEEFEKLNFDSSEQYAGPPRFEAELSGKMSELRLQNGAAQFLGGTSNLIFVGSDFDAEDGTPGGTIADQYQPQENPITSWTTVTSNPELTLHLLKMYFTWHYPYFTTLSRSSFGRDFTSGKLTDGSKRKYCSSLLVNAMLALGCHFSSRIEARSDAQDSATAGDHFFKEAKRLILENDEHENPRLVTVQALALMSVREAGCGRESKGWVYSGMSFRMALDLGLNIDSSNSGQDEEEVDARRITFWGCFLFDKQPQLPLSSITVSKFDVFPDEEAKPWVLYGDVSPGQQPPQPSRTRTIALQISSLCEISSDLMLYFYSPTQSEKPIGKQAEIKRLSELHMRLEAWRKNLPQELEAREGQLPHALLMHMFFHLLFIHLFRPFLRYDQTSSPLGPHVSPRKICTQAAAMISKLIRLYKRNYGLRQICNIAVYIAHSACTIHLLNLPDKNAKRDIVHGLKNLEEIGEGWLCARRTLHIFEVLVRKWNIDLPEEAATILSRASIKYGHRSSSTNALSPAASDASSAGPYNQNFNPNDSSLPPGMMLNSPPDTPGQPQNTFVGNSFATTNGHTNMPNIQPNSMRRPKYDSQPQSLPQYIQQQPHAANVYSHQNSHAQQKQHQRPPSQSQYQASQKPPPSQSRPPAIRPHPPPPSTSTIKDPAHSSTLRTSPTVFFSSTDNGQPQTTMEPQDWWIEDQANLASGFENWTTGLDLTTNGNGVTGDTSGHDSVDLGMFAEDMLGGSANGVLHGLSNGHGIESGIGRGGGSVDGWGHFS
ncbi:hypothetical protein MMC25_006267 [Agyrium rufum]|nr:hypothetical protein [Agyrium rufum]